MENKNEKTFRSFGMKYLILFAVLALSAACSNKRSTPVTPTNNTVNNANRYAFNGTSCIDTTNNLQVDPTLCGIAQNPTGNFQLIGGQCFDSQGNAVDLSLCSQAQVPQQPQYPDYGSQYPQQYPQTQYPDPYGSQYPTYGNQCFGTFQSMNGQQVYCSGSNCSGTYLINPLTGQSVYCQ